MLTLRILFRPVSTLLGPKIFVKLSASFGMPLVWLSSKQCAPFPAAISTQLPEACRFSSPP